jgi:hypothetical protein
VIAHPIALRSAAEKQSITETSAWAVIDYPNGNHIGLFEGVVG